jgi:hypothetical protein
MSVNRPLQLVVLCGVAAMLVAGCGGEDSAGEAKDPIRAVSASVRDQVASARQVDPSKFPKPAPGQALEDFAGQFDTAGPQAVSA